MRRRPEPSRMNEHGFPFCLPADGPFIHPKAAERTKVLLEQSSSFKRPSAQLALTCDRLKSLLLGLGLLRSG